jgi:hypothetical protein
VSDFGRCPRCGQYGFMNGHVCEPVWEAIHLFELEYADQVDCGKRVYARTPKEAAELFAENDDRASAEFTEIQYIVIRDSAGVLHYFEVRGELEPVYTAKETEPDKVDRAYV